MAEIPKNQTWGRQDLYPYRNKEDRLQQIDDLREVIHTGWLKDQEKKRRDEGNFYRGRGGGRGRIRKNKEKIETFFKVKCPVPENKTLRSYPLMWMTTTDDFYWCQEECRFASKQLAIARDALYTRWMEDRAEERRREVTLLQQPGENFLGTPDRYFSEWMVINDFFLEEMANPNLRKTTLMEERLALLPEPSPSADSAELQP